LTTDRLPDLLHRMDGTEKKFESDEGGDDKRKRGRPSVKPALLDAALSLVAEGGVASLTYEALCERTGLSKGGLLYHFPTKEALIVAINERLIARYRDARLEAIAALPEGPSRELKGYAIASLNNSSNSDNVSAKMMVSGLWDVEAGLKYYRERFSQMRKGVGFDRAAVVHLATEGLWFLELAGRTPFTAAERRRIVDVLMALADGGQIQDPSGAPTIQKPKKKRPKGPAS
jgi:AcrR family transcriptional regulator